MIPNQILTRSGRIFYPLDPRPQDVDLGDIAHALANKCRFTGHTEPFYSVAQHSLLVCHILGALRADPLTRLWGLLHDAAEAYLPDVAAPIKDRVFFSSLPAPSWDKPSLFTPFRDAEARILDAVAVALDIEPLNGGHLPRIVKDADLMARYAEMRDLLPGPPTVDPETCEPWDGPADMDKNSDPAKVCARFMHRLTTLKKELAWRSPGPEPLPELVHELTVASAV